jgi:small-conductance mechanosensitive channel
MMLFHAGSSTVSCFLAGKSRQISPAMLAGPGAAATAAAASSLSSALSAASSAPPSRSAVSALTLDQLFASAKRKLERRHAEQTRLLEELQAKMHAQQQLAEQVRDTQAQLDRAQAEAKNAMEAHAANDAEIAAIKKQLTVLDPAWNVEEPQFATARHCSLLFIVPLFRLNLQPDILAITHAHIILQFPRRSRPGSVPPVAFVHRAPPVPRLSTFPDR